MVNDVRSMFFDDCVNILRKRVKITALFLRISIISSDDENSTGLLSTTRIFTDFEGVIFKIGVFRRVIKITPIDSSRRELQIRF